MIQGQNCKFVKNLSSSKDIFQINFKRATSFHLTKEIKKRTLNIHDVEDLIHSSIGISDEGLRTGSTWLLLLRWLNEEGLSVSRIVRLAFDSQELLELKEELEVVIGNLTADGLLLVANTNLVNAFFLSFVFNDLLLGEIILRLKKS